MDSSSFFNDLENLNAVDIEPPFFHGQEDCEPKITEVIEDLELEIVENLNTTEIEQLTDLLDSAIDNELNSQTDAIPELEELFNKSDNANDNANDNNNNKKEVIFKTPIQTIVGGDNKENIYNDIFNAETNEDNKEEQSTLEETKEPDTKEEEITKPQEKSLEEQYTEYIGEHGKPNILFATISDTGSVSVGYNQSVIQLCINFTKLNIDYDFITIQNEHILSRAKNCIIAKVLSEQKYTHLMFIDTNLTFSWNNILELLMKNKEISGGVIPKRTINWDKVKQNVIKNNDIENAHLYAKSMNYDFDPVIYKKESESGEELQQINNDNGLIEVNTLDSHFMLLKRSALELMVDKLGIMLKFNNTYQEYNQEEIKEHFYAFFEKERTDQEYIEEDANFSKRWKKCKGQLWVYLMANINSSFYSSNVGSLYLSITS